MIALTVRQWKHRVSWLLARTARLAINSPPNHEANNSRIHQASLLLRLLQHVMSPQGSS